MLISIFDHLILKFWKSKSCGNINSSPPDDLGLALHGPEPHCFTSSSIEHITEEISI